MNSFRHCLSRFPIIFASLAGVVLLFEGVAAAPDKGEIEAEVQSIRKWFAEVETLQELRQENIEFQCEGDPMEGVLTRRYRRDTNQIVRLDLVINYSDHGAGDEIFYYRNGKVFFVLESEFSWRFAKKKGDKPGETSTVDSIRERRLYFAGGNCIRVLEKSVSSENPEKLKGLIAKAENRELDLAAVETRKIVAEIFKSAVTLPKMTNAKAVAKFFCE